MYFAHLRWRLAAPPTNTTQPTYTVRCAWAYPFDFAWSRPSKFQTLDRLSWQRLTEALSVLRTTNPEPHVDLRAHYSFDIPNLARTLTVPPPIFEVHFLCGAATG